MQGDVLYQMFRSMHTTKGLGKIPLPWVRLTTSQQVVWRAFAEKLTNEYNLESEDEEDDDICEAEDGDEVSEDVPVSVRSFGIPSTQYGGAVFWVPEGMIDPYTPALFSLAAGWYFNDVINLNGDKKTYRWKPNGPYESEIHAANAAASRAEETREWLETANATAKAIPMVETFLRQFPKA